MTTAQMKYFLVAAQQLNFTAAAEILYITQPSLSRQIATIENELGVPLFVRTNNMVSLTPEGKALYERLSVLYDDYSRIVQQVKAVHEGTSGRLSIGILEDQLLDEDLIHAINHLQSTHPNIRISFSRKDSYSLFGGLQDDTLDMAIMLLYDELLSQGLSGIALSESRPFWAIAKEKAEQGVEKIVMDDLTQISAHMPVIMASLESFPPQIREPLTQFPPIAFNPIPPDNIRYIDQTGAIAFYVTSGMGGSLVNARNILRIDPRVKMIPVVDGSIMTQGLLWKSNCTNPLVKVLVNTLAGIRSEKTN